MLNSQFFMSKLICSKLLYWSTKLINNSLPPQTREALLTFRRETKSHFSVSQMIDRSLALSLLIDS